MGALGLSLGGACASQPTPLRFEAATSFDAKAPRRPPGVAVDPMPELPLPSADASTAQGVVSLRQPPDLGRARETVRAFFHAVTTEDVLELESLLARDAAVQVDPQSGRRKARDFWRMRLSQLDYDQVGSGAIFREAEVEWFRPEAMHRLTQGGYPQLELLASDVVLRVPITTPTATKQHLFGPEIVFVLRPTPHGFRIAEMYEPFQLP